MKTQFFSTDIQWKPSFLALIFNENLVFSTDIQWKPSF